MPPPQPLVFPRAGLERALSQQEAVHEVLEAGGGQVVLGHGQVLLQVEDGVRGAGGQVQGLAWPLQDHHWRPPVPAACLQLGQHVPEPGLGGYLALPRSDKVGMCLSLCSLLPGVAAARPAAELVRGGGGEIEGQQRPELGACHHRVPGDGVVRVQVQRRARVRLAAGRCYTPLHRPLHWPLHTWRWPIGSQSRYPTAGTNLQQVV